MTKEMIRQIENDYWEEKADPIDMAEVFGLAIKALEQQPCEDCISREEVKRILADQRDELIKLHTVNPEDNPKADAMAYGVNWSLNTLMELPSVTQQPCEEENPNCTECRYYDHEKHHCPRFCKVIENTMAEITSEQARWIPCSERMPKVGEKVLCQCRANIYDVLKLTVDGWYHDENHCYMSGFVLAWMPLPQPYAESEE